MQPRKTRWALTLTLVLTLHTLSRTLTHLPDDRLRLSQKVSSVHQTLWRLDLSTARDQDEPDCREMRESLQQLQVQFEEDIEALRVLREQFTRSSDKTPSSDTENDIL